MGAKNEDKLAKFYRESSKKEFKSAMNFLEASKNTRFPTGDEVSSILKNAEVYELPKGDEEIKRRHSSDTESK